MINTYVIHESNMDLLQVKIDKVNKKATKLGQALIISRTLKEEFIEVKGQDGESNHYEKYFTVEIEADIVRVSGFEFIATLNHTYETGNIIKAHSDIVIPERFRTSDGYCEHCHTSRQRKETVILRNEESGEFIQIGRNCCKDFLGHDIHNEAKWLDAIKSINDEVKDLESTEKCDTFAKHIDVEELICMVFELVDRHGYVNRAKAEEFGGSTTCGWATSLIMYGASRYNEEEFEIVKLYMRNIDKAKEALAWIREQETSNQSDYMNNLKIMCSGDYIGYRETKFAGSLVATYYNWIHREEEKKAKAEKALQAPSQYIGTIGERLEFTATVQKQFSFDTQFGVSYITILETPEGNILKWAGNGSSMNEKCSYTFKGTIKDHVEYKDVKQTVLTRCMGIKEIPAQ